MNIIDRLNSGELHQAARQRRPECVDSVGGIHKTPERARFISWVFKMQRLYGKDVRTWPEISRAEYAARHVSAR